MRDDAPLKIPPTMTAVAMTGMATAMATRMSLAGGGSCAISAGGTGLPLNTAASAI